MKLVSLNSKVISISKQRTVVALSAMCALSIMSSTPAFAAERVFQLLGACNGGRAEFSGSSKKGRSQLSSAMADAIAGFFLDGVEGKTVSQLSTISVTFEPPDSATATEFTMRIRVAGSEVDRIQNFHIGNETFKNLPNLPTRKTGAGYEVLILPEQLIGGKSRLTGDEVIKKISFIFNSKATGAVYKQFIDAVEYDDAPVSLLLDPVTCNLR